MKTTHIEKITFLRYFASSTDAKEITEQNGPTLLFLDCQVEYPFATYTEIQANSASKLLNSGFGDCILSFNITLGDLWNVFYKLTVRLLLLIGDLRLKFIRPV